MSKTQAEMQSQYKYAKKALHRVPLDLFHKDYETLRSAAADVGLSVNGYVKDAIREKMISDGFAIPQDFLQAPGKAKNLDQG
jgi:hypothetical protein